MPSHDPVTPAADRPAGLAETAVRGPVRRLQATTLGTGVLSALASAGVLTLQADRGYARAVLEARSWGAVEVTDADVAAFLTPDGGAPLTAAVILALTGLLVWGIQRLWRPTRWAGTVAAVVGMLSGAFWSVDGGRMVAAGPAGVLVLLAACAMVVFCAVWLLVAHRRDTRDAFDG
ncbi:hypothetical protein E4A47_06875 [Micrococcus flavus]|uniref:Uncharacterized protein n=1 Tax=Micrococcus flavus TaxID=384602 RepID=A0A4Y8X178_9MICC|nr:hypothetical protein [Micrococcus flavus]MBB4883360.1 hypothetical protein [Micrococcus flavus]TFI02799.1 hypothetical protein E4A47_06875 [Micrococcus flavus]GGK44421.1 hypothetical protein GCM10007073_09390 [Micrococcus flavus]